MKGKPMSDPIEQFLSTYPPEIQTISSELRAMVKSVMPQANEVLYVKHNHFAYSFTRSSRDSICYICPMKDYARLGFMYGTHLSDPEHMLVGTGKRLRHVKVRNAQEASHPALKNLVEAAWADALTHM
jgi:hypothetical protein